MGQIRKTKSGSFKRMLALSAALQIGAVGNALAQDDAPSPAEAPSEAQATEQAPAETQAPESAAQDTQNSEPRLVASSSTIEALGNMADKVLDWAGRDYVLVFSQQDLQDPDYISQEIDKLQTYLRTTLSEHMPDLHDYFAKFSLSPDLAEQTAQSLEVGQPSAMVLGGNTDAGVDPLACIVTLPSNNVTGEFHISINSGIDRATLENIPLSDEEARAIISAHEIGGHCRQIMTSQRGYAYDQSITLWAENDADQRAYGIHADEVGEEGVFTNPDTPYIQMMARAIGAIVYGPRSHDHSTAMSTTERKIDIPDMRAAPVTEKLMFTNGMRSYSRNMMMTDAVYQTVAVLEKANWEDLPADHIFEAISMQLLTRTNRQDIHQIMRSDDDAKTKLQNLSKLEDPAQQISQTLRYGAGVVTVWGDRILEMRKNGYALTAKPRELKMLTNAVGKTLQTGVFAKDKAITRALEIYIDGVATFAPDASQVKQALKPLQQKQSMKQERRRVRPTKSKLPLNLT